jgi:outer membrane protein assembly factor BamB
MFDLFALDDGTIFTYGHNWSRLDQETGKLLGFGGTGGNARCDTGACTVKLVAAGFGNFYDLSSKDLRWTKRDFARSQCGGSTTPGYGMLYYHGSGCGCFFPIRGNMALHHTSLPASLPDEQRLVKGPAAEKPLGAAASGKDWPEYLFNGQRHAWNPQDGPRKLRELWKTKIAEPLAADVTGVRRDWLNTGFYNGPVTAPVVVSGLVVVADRDGRHVVAIDAASGVERWRFLAGGRVFTPPTYARGRFVFGTRDGWVHCLEAESGRVAWQFLAAPAQRYLVAYGQVESAWPVHGCLPVAKDTVVATAGYHAEADGGIRAWGLDLATGAVKWSKCLKREREWKTFISKKTREGQSYLSVRDDEHPLCSRNQSNGQYNPTKVRNVDLPMSDGEIVEVANVCLDPATGELSEGQIKDPVFFPGERFPFLDMSFEDRGGPHGSGSWGTYLGKIRVAGGRGDALRVAQDGKNALVVAQTRDHKVGPGLYLIKSDVQTDKYGRVRISDQKTFATTKNRVGTEADSLAVSGAVAYIASEGHLMRPWGKEQRPRPRWRKGEAIGGQIEAFSVPGGEALSEIELDSAVINNGLAVAGGKLYAVCEDGTVRCYGD